MCEKSSANEAWRDKKFAFFNHSECEAFPCHATDDRDNFNCLFCYCPLYVLGGKCGGKFTYLPNGIKDCAHCVMPHQRANYGYIAGRFQDIALKMNQNIDEAEVD